VGWPGPEDDPPLARAGLPVIFEGELVNVLILISALHSSVSNVHKIPVSVLAIVLDDLSQTSMPRPSVDVVPWRQP